MCIRDRYINSSQMMLEINNAVQLAKGFHEALSLIYFRLFELGHVQKIELEALNLWLAACQSLQSNF